MQICRDAEKVKSGAQDKPLTPIRIADCGELTERLSKEDCDYLKTYDGPETETPEESRVEM